MSGRVTLLAIVGAIVVSIVGGAFLLGGQPPATAEAPAGDSDGAGTPTEAAPRTDADQGRTATRDPPPDGGQESAPVGTAEDSHYPPADGGEEQDAPGDDGLGQGAVVEPAFGTVSAWIVSDHCDSATRFHQATNVNNLSDGPVTTCAWSTGRSLFIEGPQQDFEMPAQTKVEGTLYLGATTTDPTQEGKVLVQLYQGRDMEDANLTNIGRQTLTVPAGTSMVTPYAISIETSQALPAGADHFVRIQTYHFILSVNVAFDLEEHPTRFDWQAP